MTHPTRISLILVLGLSACTTAAESDVAALGAALGGLDLPQIPSNQLPPGQQPQPVLLCPSKPDLNITSISATNSGFKNYLYVCARVMNGGGAAWSSNASQIATRATTNAAGTTTANAGSITSLAVGATVSKCGWVKVPGLLRMGHDEAQWGECTATLTAKSQFVFDPDITTDGNTANDDCVAANNKRSASFNYMVACPW